MYINKNKNTATAILHIAYVRIFGTSILNKMTDYKFGLQLTKQFDPDKMIHICINEEVPGVKRVYKEMWSVPRGRIVAIEFGIDDCNNWKIISVKLVEHDDPKELKVIEKRDKQFLKVLSKRKGFNGSLWDDIDKNDKYNIDEEDEAEENNYIEEKESDIENEDDIKNAKEEEVEEEEEEIGEDDELIIVGRLDGRVSRYYEEYRIGLDFRGAKPTKDETLFGSCMTTYNQIYIWPATEGLDELRRNGCNRDLVVVKGEFYTTRDGREGFKPSYVGLVSKDDEKYNRIITIEMAKSIQLKERIAKLSKMH